MSQLVLHSPHRAVRTTCTLAVFRLLLRYSIHHHRHIGRADAPTLARRRTLAFGSRAGSLFVLPFPAPGVSVK